MGERAMVVDSDIQEIIEAFSLLLPEDREQILYFARHPEELRHLARFEEIQITGPPEQST